MNVGQIEYTIDAKTAPYLQQVSNVKKHNETLGKSFNKLDKEVDKYGNELKAVDRQMGRFIDKTGRMREANGQFVKGLSSGALAANKLSFAISGIMSAAKVAGALTLAAGAAAALTMQQTELIKSMDVLATRSNMAIDDFQAWGAAARSVNVDAAELSQTLQDVSDRVGEFTKDQSGEFTDIYEKYLKPMGIGIEELRSMKPDEVLQLVAKGMREAGASGNEMTAAFEQIASNSSYLIPLLDGTGEGIKNIKDQMNRDGTLITEDEVARANELNIKTAQLSMQYDALKQDIALALIDPLTEAVLIVNRMITGMREFSSWAKKAGEFLSTDAQLANIKAMKARDAFKGTEAIPQGNSGNVTDTFASFGYGSASPKSQPFVPKGSNALAKPVSMPKQPSFSGNEFMSSFGGQLDEGDGFATGISAGIAADNETLMEELTRQRELLLEFQELEIGDAEAHAEALAVIDKQIADEKRKNDQVMLSASSDFFGGMGDLVKGFAGEQNTAYKMLFAVSKGFAIANAALQMQTAIANASALPFPANLPAIAQAVTLGGQIASNIGGLSYGGGREKGGAVSGGSFYQMGEGNKPEVLQTAGGLFGIPGDKGQVFNRQQLEKIETKGGGGITVIVNNAPEGTQVAQNGNEVVIDLAVRRSQDNFVQQMDAKQGSMFNAITRNTSAKTVL